MDYPIPKLKTNQLIFIIYIGTIGYYRFVHIYIFVHIDVSSVLWFFTIHSLLTSSPGDQYYIQRVSQLLAIPYGVTFEHK